MTAYKIKYYLFMSLCLFTHPFRWLMPFWKNKHLNFALRILFWRDVVCNTLFGQSSMETNKFESNLCKNYNNYFGMGYSEARHQAGFQKSAYFSPLTNEPTNRAVYNSVYQSVFDYYVCIKQNYPQAWYTIKTARKATKVDDFKQLVGFTYAYSSMLKDGGYFTGNYNNYAAAIEAHLNGYENPYWRFILCLVYSVLVPYVVVCILIRALRH